MHHRAGLARLLADDGLAEAQVDDLLARIEAHVRGEEAVPTGLTAREAACLGYANQVTAYFAYVNRVVDGLGVQLEPEHGSS